MNGNFVDIITRISKWMAGEIYDFQSSKRDRQILIHRLRNYISDVWNLKILLGSKEKVAEVSFNKKHDDYLMKDI